MTHLTKPNWKGARCFIDALTDKVDAAVTIQVFSDRGGSCIPEFRYCKLVDVSTQKWLIGKIKSGAGIFVTVNATDGLGRRRQNIKHYRACFVDLDGAPLPSEFPLEPHIILELSKGRYHLYWLVEIGTDLALWSDTQAMLAAFYKGDAKVIDPPRVMRLPGFDHQKGIPFRSHILRFNRGARRKLEAVREAHPCHYEKPHAPAAPIDAPEEVELDTEAAVAAARAYITNVEKPGQGERNNAAYAAACRLRDLAISSEKSLELLHEWNDALDEPLAETELNHVICSAAKYAQNPTGIAQVMRASDDFATDTSELTAADFEGDDDDDFKKREIIKLNDVTIHNVFQTFRYVLMGNKVRIVWWTYSALDRNVRVPTFMSVAEFRNALANKTFLRVTKNAKGHELTSRVSVADAFISDNKKRYTYDGVVLLAEMDSASPDSINLWRGYGVTAKPGNWSLMREHIRKVIANGKADRDRYIIRWVAWALQNADQPCEVALILKSSTHGTGKGFLLRTVRKLFGAHAMQISKSGLLTGRFNAHLSMTCFLFVDEMTLGDNKESAALNSLLTEDSLAVEPKGVDAYMMPNHVKVAAASNQDHVVLVAGTDRRFMVFDVSDKHARDVTYFKAMQAELDAGGYEAMLYDLLHMDLDGWHPRQTEDCEDDKNPEKVQSAPPEVEWLAGYLESRCARLPDASPCRASSVCRRLL